MRLDTGRIIATRHQLVVMLLAEFYVTRNDRSAVVTVLATLEELTLQRDQLGMRQVVVLERGGSDGAGQRDVLALAAREEVAGEGADQLDVVHPLAKVEVIGLGVAIQLTYNDTFWSCLPDAVGNIPNTPRRCDLDEGEVEGGDEGEQTGKHLVNASR